ncbi:hypothetical protein [Streptomyces sp. NPDC056061]|uniref:hypothetical protein n=1 Tax=Streptomyces sp. NPDC056061 TaxID=3345700 RepID=UPI0035DB096A
MTTPIQDIPVNFMLCPMDKSVQDLERLAPELPAVILTRDFVTHTVESALLRIPLPPAVLSHDPATHRYVVRSGGGTLAALYEFMRPGSEARLIGAEFDLPDGCTGATFAELPGRAKLRIREAPLNLFEVAPAASDALVASLTRRMTGCPGGGTA